MSKETWLDEEQELTRLTLGKVVKSIECCSNLVTIYFADGSRLDIEPETLKVIGIEYSSLNVEYYDATST